MKKYETFQKDNTYHIKNTKKQEVTIKDKSQKRGNTYPCKSV